MEERVKFLDYDILCPHTGKERDCWRAIETCAKTLRDIFATTEHDQGRAIAVMDTLTIAAAQSSQAIALKRLKKT